MSRLLPSLKGPMGIKTESCSDGPESCGVQFGVVFFWGGMGCRAQGPGVWDPELFGLRLRVRVWTLDAGICNPFRTSNLVDASLANAKKV